MLSLPRQIRHQRSFLGHIALYSSKSNKDVTKDKSAEEIPKNLLEDFITAHRQPGNGMVYDKKPFKITLEAGKKYFWCLCGHSHTQPFCDGTHQNIYMKITQRPVAFKVAETKEYWLCNCKHTTHRPFCDGTHKGPEVQASTSIVRQ